MKMIVALIQPYKLPDVKESLLNVGVHKMTVTNAVGCGQQKGFHETYRGVEHDINLLPKLRLETVVNEDYAEKTIEAIVKGARTGNIGDGKIFVVDLQECVRIRTGERGTDAVG